MPKCVETKKFWIVDSNVGLIYVPRDGRWTFNGDFERPTFSPSLLETSQQWNEENQAQEPYVNHIFVTNGQIQYLSDCTHSFAGTIVDLPDFEEHRLEYFKKNYDY